ncbi:MAG: biotin-dependent carboxyltransferase family protein [Opitutales bacterium]
MLTTVQDLGRHGARMAGLPGGGAVDAYALRLANLLVGNEARAAGLEMTLVGAELEFGAEALVAVTGADMGALDRSKPVRVKAGDRLKFGPATAGCRAYLAVAGGFDVPEVLGGRGTDLRTGLGGHLGRALQAGDMLKVAAPARGLRPGHWSIDPHLQSPCDPHPVLRVLPGAQESEFGGGLYQNQFKVSAHSDRMGLRLTGARQARDNARELPSAAVSPGAVQIPPEGDPIILLADAQTIGGYPCAAHVIHVDLPLAAQLRPGDGVRFAAIELPEAHRSWLAQERALGLLQEGLEQKLR